MIDNIEYSNNEESKLGDQQRSSRKQIIIIGAGPAGLTAGYELAKLDLHPTILETGDKVGGLARTENYKGYHFDIGGHRFFTKVEEVNKLWHELLGENLLRRPRLSRIYYKGRFFDYPLKPFNALSGLGVFETFLIVGSYIHWQLFPYKEEESFEQWVTNRFGKRLFLTFFKTYTEKVWGISCSELKSEWAAQRIKDLSLKTAILSMFIKPKNKIKTLIDAFDYPRLGPGMMWSVVKDRIERNGGIVRLNSAVTRISRCGNRIAAVVLANNGHCESISGDEFISSMPLTDFVKKLDPPAPLEVIEAANKLTYRDFLTICVIVAKEKLFPDNWIYVHDPEVQVGRIQNFKNWSPSMVPDQSKTSLGLEYFCTEGDELWKTSDTDLIELAKHELQQIGLASPADIEDGCVVRVPKAYPIYDSGYRQHLEIVKRFAGEFENFQTIGRNGLHRYNNQDHAMVTGMLAAKNVTNGFRSDVWSVNTDQDYLEEISEKTPHDVEELAGTLEGAIARVFPKLDRVAFGLSLGLVAGTILLFATLALVLKGGDVVGPNLQLLNQYFPGYSVTVTGSFYGLAYGLVSGFIGGWSFALMRNAATFMTMALIHRRAEWKLMQELFRYF